MTRTSIVAMLMAVELLIVGIGLYALRGRYGFPMHGGRTWTAAAIAPIAAGNAPQIEVDVPAGAHLTIARCSGATVSGLQGGVEVHSQDGRITMDQINGQALVARSDDGSIHLDDVRANDIDAQSRDGQIDVTGITMFGDAPHAILHSDDGEVRVALQRDADLVVDASTNDGNIYVDGSAAQAAGDDDSAHHTIRLGNGSGSLRASSNDGSIHITTNGAV